MGEVGFSLGQPYSRGGSFQQPVRGVAPAAGSSFSLQMDGRYVSRLTSIVFTLTTSATVANRYVTVEFQGDDGTAWCVNAAAFVVAASATQRFAGQVGRGSGEQAAGTDILFPLAPVFIHGGDTLAIVVGNVAAADTLTGIRMVFDRFPTAESAYPGRSE